MYEILIIWEDDTKTYEVAPTIAEAKRIIMNYKIAYGKQIKYARYIYIL